MNEAEAFFVAPLKLCDPKKSRKRIFRHTEIYVFPYINNSLSLWKNFYVFYQSGIYELVSR